MYMRIAALLPIAALAAVVAAVPGDLAARQSQCNTGSIQCCQSTDTENSETVSQLAGLLGINLPSIAGLVGLNCVGVLSANDCQQQPVCCTDNSYNGLINLGCDPINLNL